MFASKKTISSNRFALHERYEERQEKKEEKHLFDEMFSKNDSIIKNQEVRRNLSIPILTTDNSKYTYGTVAVAAAPISSSAVAMNSVQTYRIGQSFITLKNNIIKRGTQYANNTLATRRGFIAENFVADTYNIDATIKNVKDRAIVPDSHDRASADVVYDNGEKGAQLKFYKDGPSSAKAQTNPEYGDQSRIIPSDQVKDGIDTLNSMAEKNELKGRNEAAKIQRETAQKIDSTIKGTEGAESTPLTKKDADNLSKAFGVDEDGKASCDNSRIDKALKDTGITDKVNKAKFSNELKGIGIAAAIGLGTGLAIGMIVSLAQNGLNPESLKYAFIDGAKQGAGSAVMSAGGAAIGMAARNTAESIAQMIIGSVNLDPISSAAQNIYQMCDMGVVGMLTIMAVSVYTFATLKQHGYSTKEALIRTGRSAVLSLSILLISIIAQGLCGGCAGMAVSIVAGVVITGYTLVKMNIDRKFAKELSYYTIELYKPNFA